MSDRLNIGDLVDLASRISHRVHLLRLASEDAHRHDGSLGNSIGLLAEDFRNDLDRLMEGLNSLEDAA